MESLHVKYRPRSFKEVIGQDVVIKSFEQTLADRSSHTYLLHGPSGVGKTTLARIAGEMLGAISTADVVEVDAATYSGVESMRSITAGLKYRPMGESTARIFIIDECHRLSRAGWESLLKATEEPPEWAFWFFCTTNPARVPKTIKTRATSYKLNPVSARDIGDLVEDVAKLEKIDLPSGAIDLIAREAGGSPRQALVYLTQCDNARDRAEVAELIRSAADSQDAVALAQALMANKPWSVLSEIIGAMEDENVESVRQVVYAYVAKALSGKKGEQGVDHGLRILSAFDQPFNDSDGVGKLLLAAGRVVR